MAPKKATGAAPAKKTATAPSHPSYKDMIKEALLTLKERNGSSRQALKKYILANHKNLSATPAQFDQQFNKALRTGVDKADFTQPKGSSGPVKLAKKEAAAPKKPADTTAKKSSDTKPKKAAAPKKSTTAAKPKASTAKKASTSTKKAAPKANTSTKRKTKAAPETAPAVVDVPKVLSKTKSGRVTKTPAKAASKPAAKKATGAKKAAAPKKSTPKKAAPAAEASA